MFFFSYDEGGGPYDHVPPVPGHSNEFTDASLGTIPDISSIAVNPDQLQSVPAASARQYTPHCDLRTAAIREHTREMRQRCRDSLRRLGFRVPNIVISPFTRKHYVSHTPMDHTAVIKFVENRFIESSAHLTARDAAQPNLLEFFDFNAVPWSTPPDSADAIECKRMHSGGDGSVTNGNSRRRTKLEKSMMAKSWVS